jgi:hypothetical protein
MPQLLRLAQHRERINSRFGPRQILRSRLTYHTTRLPSFTPSICFDPEHLFYRSFLDKVSSTEAIPSILATPQQPPPIKPLQVVLIDSRQLSTLSDDGVIGRLQAMPGMHLVTSVPGEGMPARTLSSWAGSPLDHCHGPRGGRRK